MKWIHAVGFHFFGGVLFRFKNKSPDPIVIVRLTPKHLTPKHPTSIPHQIPYFGHQPISLPSWERVAKLLMFSLLGILCLLVVAGSSAQSRNNFRHLDRKDGLVSDVILSVAQDTLGFMWIATPTGLNRYDGVRVQQYLVDPLRPGTIPHPRVNSLFVSKEGDLWIGTHAGMARYEASMDGFVVADLTGTDFQPIVQDIDQDSTGLLWLSTWESGLFTYNPKDGANEIVFPKTDSATEPIVRSGKNTVRTVFIRHDGRILLSGYTGVFEFNTQSKSLEAPPFSARTNRELAQQVVFSIVEDSGGDTWISSFNGVYRIDAQTGDFRKYTDPTKAGQNKVYSVFVDTQQTVWAGSAAGLLKYEVSQDRFELISHNPTDPGSIQDGTINNLFENRSGVLWIGSDEQGISSLDLYDSSIPTYVYDPLHPQRFPPGHVWDALNSSTSEGAGIWLASDFGLILWNKTSGSYRRISIPEFNSAGVRDLFRDRSGRLWVASSSGGLCLFDEKRNQCRWVSGSELPSGTVNSIDQDEEGWIWVGSSGGLVRLNPTSLLATDVLFNTSPQRPRIEGFVMSLQFDSRGNLWVGSEEGLFRLLPGGAQLDPLEIHEEGSPIQSRRSVLDIIETHSGDIWFLDQHIHKWSAATGQITTVKLAQEELQNLVLRGLTEDSQGRIWVHFDGALAFFESGSDHAEAYSHLEGRFSLQTWLGASSLLKNGELIFGFENGLYSVNPEALDKNTFIPKVLFTSLRIGPDTVFPDSSGRLSTAFQSADQVELQYDDRSIQFEFSSTQFGQPSGNSFRIRMQGLSESWIDTKIPTASFSKLDAGTYWFSVVAVSPSGTESPEKRIKVVVHPPWWGTFWFRMLMSLSGVAIVLYAVKLRTRSITAANRRLEEMVTQRTAQLDDQSRQLAEQAQSLIEADKSKSRFFSNVSHELKTPLTLIRGYLEELQESGKDRLTKRETLGVSRSLSLTGGLDRLVLQLLDLARSEANKLTLNAKRGELSSFVHGIVRDFSRLAESKHLQLILEIEEETLWMEFDSVKLHQIISNLIGNAVKFTPEYGKIWVSMAKESSDGGAQVIIEVADTGPGIPPNALDLVFNRFYQVEGATVSHAEGFGIGLSLSHDFAQLHGGMLTVASEIGAGSVFTLKLPVGEEREGNANGRTTTGTQYVDIVSADQDKEADFSVETGRKVLVVEDNAELRQFLKDTLSDTFEVSVAKNGAVAWKMLQQDRPDIILSDIMMPEMNGLTLLGLIRESEQLKNLPVVLLTARGGSEEELEGINARANDYISKPFNSKVLKARLVNLLAMTSAAFKSEIETFQMSDEDQEFFKRLDDFIFTRKEDVTLQNSDIAEALFMTERTLGRKIKELTGESTGMYLRRKRLNTARTLLEQKDVLSVSRVARSVGFSNVSYFSKIFHEEYGVDPSYYLM